MAWFKKQSIVIKIIVGLIALGLACCVCSIPIAIISPDPTPVSEKITKAEDTSTPESASVPTETPVPAETLASTEVPAPTSTPVLELSFSDIVQSPDEKGWTSSQYSTYFDTIKGQSVSGWSGTILEVDEWAGKPYVSLDMKPGEPQIDAYVYINKDDVLKVGLGQNVIIGGIIDDKWPESNGFYALQIEDVTLLELGEIPTPMSEPPTPTPGPTSVPTNTPEPSAPSFAEICGQMDKMTDAQWNKLTENVKGTYAVGWTGWVEEVNEKTFGGYELWVDMDSPDEVLSVQDVSFDIPDEIALQIQKDQPVTFSGRIDFVANILGSCQVSMSDVNFEYEQVAQSNEPPANVDTGPNAPPFEEIRSKMEGMTDAQWNKYSDSLKDKQVIDWVGWVEEVNEKVFGGYEVWVDMDSPDEFSVQDVTFDVPEDMALALQKDQKIMFSGTIDSAMNILGSSQINLVDATIKTE